MKNLRKKITSLLMVGFYGDKLSSDHHIIKDIKNGLGGVIIFDKNIDLNKKINNIQNPNQLKELCNKLQSLTDRPLLIAVDQEGGMVSRLKESAGFPTTSSPKILAQDSSLQETQKAAEQTAQMLSNSNINYNLAPVVDLNLNKENPIIGKYERSFSSDPNEVIDNTKIWVKAHQKHGVKSCLKHFPGHGSSLTDSHKGFVDISETWKERELIPYEKLIEQDLAESIMVGHLFNRSFDKELPASLSSKTINYLRKELNFNGLIISDDMQMGAIIKFHGIEKACCIAIKAGLDMLIIGNNMIHDECIVEKITNTIMEEIENGSISEELINSAHERVKKFTGEKI
ncbi:MAG: hypothetical protein OCC45_14790 [Desulfotalea sp.]